MHSRLPIWDNRNSKLPNLTEFLADRQYYAITRTVDSNGIVVTESITQFAGFADEKYHGNRELRCPAPIIPDRMISFWQSIGQPHIVINDNVAFYIYCRIGGNALIQEAVAKQWLSDWIEPREHVRVGAGGWVPVEALPEGAFKHAPSRKLRMAVIKRDRYRCRICGRSPDNYVDVELHVHHIRPFGKPTEGVTHEANLITLCQTCHDGLDPHADPDLFDFVGSGFSAMIRAIKEGHSEGVDRYRSLVQESINKLEKGSDGT